MNAPRTAVVSTTDHGDIDVPDPVWCIGFHPAGYTRAELAHVGPSVYIAADLGDPDGATPFGQAQLAERPFAEAERDRDVCVAVEVDTQWYWCSPAQVDRFAGGLVDAAVTLRALARQASVIAAGGAG